MALAPGARIGPYEITALLGAGGMGEVYRARDTKLGREVAIKVLSDTVSLDPDRLARFEREARTLASLNHPNIAQLYGIEESGSRSPGVPESSITRALVMELVEGDDLSELIGAAKATPYVPLPNALAIARQIIDALEAAHDLGIVHRDLKPANIKVREDGTVKVLDFGLAKAMTADADPGASSPSNSPTLTARATQIGMILGTAAYMSPEQARGRTVDKRTDVWAFGCVLYEMLTGDIWVTDLKRNATTRFTFDATEDNASPAWSPAGDRIAFESIRDGKPGIDIRSANGSGDAERVFETTTSRMAVPTSWSPDGKTLLFGTAEARTGPNLWTVPAEGTHKAVPRVQTTAGELSGQVSPDGRWLAYQSSETGTSEVYVQSMTATPGKWVISSGGGNAPRWRRDSRELYFIGARKLWAADIATKGDVLVPGVAKALFDYRGIQNATHISYFTSYDVTRDGQRFLVSLPETASDADRMAAPLVVVLNWMKGIK